MNRYIEIKSKRKEQKIENATVKTRCNKDCNEISTLIIQGRSYVFLFCLQHRTENVCSAVTSMVLHLNQFVLIGTAWCEIYQIQLSNFHARLLITSHTSCIYGIAFPR